MTGGIMAGASQVLSCGFRIMGKINNIGRNGGITIGNKIRLFSPNSPKNANYEFGGTILKIGSKYENIRFDVGTRIFFHINIQLAKKLNYHIPIGMIFSGLYGGV